jgi:phosphoribosyl 1,2-cyclic phosphate phosphodiesterase
MEGGFSELRYLLVTHAHTDHFYAHDFVLHGYKYAHPSLPDLEIYGNQEVKEVFEESVRREMRQEVAKSLKIHTVSAFTSFEAGEYHAVPLKATHTSQDPFVFLLEKNGKRYLHLTDTGELPEESVQYVIKSGKRLDCITFDCTFLWEQAGNRHMGLKENMALFSRLKEAGVADSNTLKVITHFSHNSHPTEEALARAQREFGVIPAYDGMTIEF